MLDYMTLRFIWWALLGVLLVGFAIMDGFDFGVAMLGKDVEKAGAADERTGAVVDHGEGHVRRAEEVVAQPCGESVERPGAGLAEEVGKGVWRGDGEEGGRVGERERTQCDARPRERGC